LARKLQLTNMKKEFLKMAGVENEKDFYKLFPTEQAFFGMFPEAKKLVQKRYGGLVKAVGGFNVTSESTRPAATCGKGGCNNPDNFVDNRMMNIINKQKEAKPTTPWQNITSKVGLENENEMLKKEWEQTSKNYPGLTYDEFFAANQLERNNRLNQSQYNNYFDEQGNPIEGKDPRAYSSQPYIPWVRSTFNNPTPSRETIMRYFQDYKLNKNDIENLVNERYTPKNQIAPSYFRAGGALTQFQPGGSNASLPGYLQVRDKQYGSQGDIVNRGMSVGTKAAIQPQIKEEQVVKQIMKKTGASRPVAQQIRQQQTQKKSNVTVGQDNRTDYERKVAQQKVDDVNKYRTEVLGIPEGTTQRDLDEANKYKERLGRILNVGLTAAPLLEGALSLGARAIPMAGRTASRLVAPTSTSTRQATIQSFNPKTKMYETRLVDIPEQIIPGRSFEDVQHKIPSLLKDLKIGPVEHWFRKNFKGIGKSIPTNNDQGLVIDPTGKIWDKNTRYWLNRLYGHTPDPLELIKPYQGQYSRNFGTLISESPKPNLTSGSFNFVGKSGIQGQPLQSGLLNTRDLGQMIRNPKQYFTKPGGPQKFEVNFDEISRMNRGEIDPFGETGRFFTFGETPSRVIDWGKVGETALQLGLGTGSVASGAYLGSQRNKKQDGGLVKAQDGAEYTGSSIVDYLATKGYQGSKPFRGQLAKEYGVEGYDYSAAKNLELLEKLRQNQDILLAHQQSFTPVSVETIEQLHAKNKAGLDRHSSLPGKEEARSNYNADKLNALLDIATMDINKGMGTMPQFGFNNASQYAAMNKKPSVSTEEYSSDPTTEDYTADPGGYYKTIQEGEEAFVLPEVVVTSPVTKKQIQEIKAKKGAMDQFNKYLDYSRSLLQIPFRPGQQPISQRKEEYTEFDVLPEEGLPNKQNQKNNLGFFDYLNLGTKAAGLFLGEFLDPTKNIERISSGVNDIFQLGQNYFARKNALKEGDDLNKSKSTISIPKVEKPVVSQSPLVLESTPYAEGSAIEMYDKNEAYDKKNKRYITKPLWLDLSSSSLRLGARNRGSRLGDIKTEGFVITPFAKEYGMGEGYTDNNGTNTIRRYSDNEIADDKIYGGIDAEGKFYLDYGKNLKGKNLEMADFRSAEITGIAKEKNGKYMYSDATSNYEVARTAMAFDENGNPTVNLNILIPKKQIDKGHESFGAVGGGRYILATPDLKKKVLVAGSLKNIDDYVEQFKKATGLSVIKLIPLDNGTFARGLFTKDGVITNKDQNRYDNFNHTGGAAFYLKQKRHGGSVLSKMQGGGTPPNCDPGYMPDPNDPTKCIQDPNIFAMFKPPSMDDETFGDPFSTTSTTTTWVQWYNQNLANSVIDPPSGKSIMDMKWEGDPTYDPSKETDMYGNVITSTTTKAPRYLFGKFGEWMDKKGAAAFTQVAKGLNTGFALGNRLAAEKQHRDFQKSYEKNLRNKIFTQPVMPSVSGSRGDYTQTGAFRPNEYTVNKGMYTSNMPGAIVGTQQFAQFGGGIIGEQLVVPETEFSPIVTPEVVVETPASSVQPQTTNTTTTPPSSSSSKPKKYNFAGVNPVIEQTWDEILKQYAGVRMSGIWGDKKHRQRESDHNTGNALDIGIVNIDQGNKIAEQIISQAKEKRVKYVIFNRRVWNPQEGWHKYIPTKANGNNPHTTHVHISFFPYEGKKNDKKTGESIALTHNNPGNIHFGKFTSQWGAEKGAYDNKGHVAKFKSLDEGWDAHKKLLSGPDYSDFTIEQARNKWVTGDPNKITDSSKFILKELGVGANLKIRDLTQDQFNKLASLFVKYEDNILYKKMKDLKKYFELGGEVSYNEGEEYDLTEDQIRQILENGGDIEYI